MYIYLILRLSHRRAWMLSELRGFEKCRRTEAGWRSKWQFEPARSAGALEMTARNDCSICIYIYIYKYRVCVHM